MEHPGGNVLPENSRVRPRLDRMEPDLLDRVCEEAGLGEAFEVARLAEFRLVDLRRVAAGSVGRKGDIDDCLHTALGSRSSALAAR